MSVINYNYAANAASNVINRTDRQLDKTMAKISSGTRVGPGHNEVGLFGMYNNMKIEGRQSRIALDNLNFGLAQMKMIETVAMEISTIATRMGELAIAASNTTIPADDRYAMDAEFGALLTEWDRLATEAQFNGTTKYMDGSTELVLYTGTTTANANVTIELDSWLPDANEANGAEIATGAKSASGAASVGGADGALGVTATAANHPVPDTLHETITTSATAVLSAAKLANIVPRIASAVSRIGGQISALEHSINAQAGISIAKEAGASAIGDVDYASETAALASQQVISQAATAILAQANARTATVLTLLK
jgi:flagellin